MTTYSLIHKLNNQNVFRYIQNIFEEFGELVMPTDHANLHMTFLHNVKNDEDINVAKTLLKEILLDPLVYHNVIIVGNMLMIQYRMSKENITKYKKIIEQYENNQSGIFRIPLLVIHVGTIVKPLKSHGVTVMMHTLQISELDLCVA
jgi:hypothetical protein